MELDGGKAPWMRSQRNAEISLVQQSNFRDDSKEKTMTVALPSPLAEYFAAANAAGEKVRIEDALKGGKIAEMRVFFDARPFAAMFEQH